MNYFEVDAISNSSFSAFAKDLKNLEDPENLEFHYAFGTLVDAILTEDNQSVEEAAASEFLDDDDRNHAKTLANHCRDSKFIRNLLSLGVSQYIFIRNLKFECETQSFELRCKCKFDLFIKRFSTGIDFKTVSAKNEKEFRSAIDHFNWDRQASFYMDLAKINRFWIIGISKINGKIFQYAINRYDSNYENGKSKYLYWGEKYYNLIHNLNI